MSSRQERKAEARAAREAVERKETAHAARRRRLWQLGAVTAFAAVVVGVLVLINQSGDEADAGARDPSSGLAGVREARELFEGIPQDGTSLGSPRAKRVLTEYADLQCPFCRAYAVDVLPGIVERYVRPGRLRLELRTLRFIGEDSTRGARAAHAAAAKDRMWNFVDLFFRNQGAENSGFADDDFIGRVSHAAGVPSRTALGAIASPGQDVPIQRAEREARILGVESTPTFMLGRKPATGRPLDSTELQAELERELGA